MTTPIRATRQHVKTLAVVKQGLHTQDPDLRRVITRIGLLQLDSIHVVARSHYLVMLARAGVYNPADLDALLDSGFLFEAWAHAACLVPSADYPFFHANFLKKRQSKPPWFYDRLGDKADEIANLALETIRQRGAMSSKDFELGEKPPGGWWNWKPAKVALEYLLARGELLVSHRRNFQRYYNLPERVLSGRNFSLDKTYADFQRFTIERGLRHIGIGTSNHVAKYYHQKKRLAAAVIKDLVAGGESLPVKVDGWDADAYIHRDDLELLRRVQNGEFQPSRTVFLSPFDNLFLGPRPRRSAVGFLLSHRGLHPQSQARARLLCHAHPARTRAGRAHRPQSRPQSQAPHLPQPAH